MTEPGKRTHGLPAGQTGLLVAALALACAGTVPPALAADPVVIQGSDINSAGSYPPSFMAHISSLEDAVALLVSTYHFTEAEAEEVINEAYAAKEEPAIDAEVRGTITLENSGDVYVQSTKSLTLNGEGGNALEVTGSKIVLEALEKLEIKGGVISSDSKNQWNLGTGDNTMTGDLTLSNGSSLEIDGSNYPQTISAVLNGNLTVTDSSFSVNYMHENTSAAFTFNGAVNVTRSTVTISQYYDTGSVLTFNGGICLHNGTFVITSAEGAENSVVIRGDIRVSGDSASVYSRTVSPVPVPDAYGESIPDKDFNVERTRNSWYSYLEHKDILGALNFTHLTPVDLPKMPATIFSIGSIDEDAYTFGSLNSNPTNYAVTKFEGNIYLTNTEETANSVRITLDAPGEGDWTWLGSATMDGTDWEGSSYKQTGIMITAKEGAVWKVTGEESTEYGMLSTIGRWTSLGNTTIDMTAFDKNLTLRIDQLSGSGTTFIQKIGANTDGSSVETDLVIVGGRSSGEHTVRLQAAGRPIGSVSAGEITYFKVLPIIESITLTSTQTDGYPTKTPEEVNAKLAWWGTNTMVFYNLVGYSEVFENDSSQFNLTYEENADGSGKTATITVNGQKIYSFAGYHFLTHDVDGLEDWSFHQETYGFEPLIIHYGDAENKVDIGNYKYTILDPKMLGDGTVVFNVLAPDIPAATFEDLSDAAEIVTTLGGDGAMYSAWMADLTDLRKRLGEVRYGAQDGVWARGIAQKDRLEGVTGADFKQKLYGLQMGLDHIVTQDEDRMWLLGGNLKLNTVDQKVDAMRYGHGDMRSYGAFLYATYANYKGCYTDLVLSVDHYKQKMSAEQTDDSYVHGRYNTWGWGASVEVGRMFSSAQNDEGWGPWYGHWWAEPQAQLAYYWVNGKRFSMDNEMSVRQKNGNSLIGRLGIVVGKKFNYGANRREVDKRYSQFYLKGGVKHEFLGKQTLYVNDQKFSDRLRGTTVYYGAGFDWNLSDQLRLYAQVERERGSRYRKDYEVSAGLKWQF